MTLPDHTWEWLIQMDDFKSKRLKFAPGNGKNFLTERDEGNESLKALFPNSSKGFPLDPPSLASVQLLFATIEGISKSPRCANARGACRRCAGDASEPY